MKLIAVISHKGGAGKTTSSVQIAEELARRGHRTLLVDADRQQGAGLLLGIESPAGCVQRTMVPQLDYLGSARLTDLEIADCYQNVAGRFDVGVVDTPSLDDALARAWLREAAAALMVLQVDPLTVKTLPSALNTLEVVRAFKPNIQILGLLPTMFDPAEEAHGRLLAELLSRRPEAVFTPVVPADPGLMHRANGEECPPLGETARQAYQCAVDRILRALETAAPSVAMPRAASPAPVGMAAGPAPADARAPVSAGPEPRRWEAPEPAASPGHDPRAESLAPPAADLRSPTGGGHPAAAESDRALDALSGSAVAPPGWTDEGRRPQAGSPASEYPDPAPQPPAARARKRAAENAIPDWWPRPDVRVDATGVARRRESWWARSRFAIACTVACLALVAAVLLGTGRRVAVDTSRSAWKLRLPAALAATRGARPGVSKGRSAAHSGAAHKKSAAAKHARYRKQTSRSGGATQETK